MKFNCILLASILVWSACSNPFAPEKHKPPDDITEPPAPPADTPELLIDNLHRAMRDRDKDLYESLLDQDFWFTEDDCQGEQVFQNGREEELEFMGGSRDGTRPGIFDIYRSTFEFDFTLTKRDTELGIEYPEAYEGDPDGHPDEDWEIFTGRVQMLMIDLNGDGFRVDQVMTFKLRQAEDSLWKIIRWVDDPLAGDCGAARPLAGLASWSAVKQRTR